MADQHIKTITVGESRHQCCDEWMASNSCECSPFISNMLHLLQPNDCRSMALDTTCLPLSDVKVSMFSYCRFCVISSVQRLGNRCCSLNRQLRLQAIPWRTFLDRFNLHSADFHFRNLRLTRAKSLDKLEVLYSELMRRCCELFIPRGVCYLVRSQRLCIFAEVGDELFFLLAFLVIDWGRIGGGAPVAVQEFMRSVLDGRCGHAVTAWSVSREMRATGGIHAQRFNGVGDH